MKIEIKSIAGKGDSKTERLILRVLSDINIGDYLVLQTGFHNGEVTIGIDRAYWFPYKAVSTGDMVVIYTKSGKTSEKEMMEGKKAHFYYWGLDKEIWNKADKVPVVVSAPEWIVKEPDDKNEVEEDKT